MHFQGSSLPREEFPVLFSCALVSVLWCSRGRTFDRAWGVGAGRGCPHLAAHWHRVGAGRIHLVPGVTWQRVCWREVIAQVAAFRKKWMV